MSNKKSLGKKNPKEIVSVLNNRVLVAFEDNFKPAPPHEYAKVHAKKSIVEGYKYKRTSLLNIIIQDYSNGTGEDNVISIYQISPSIARYIYSRIFCGHSKFYYHDEKTFGPNLPNKATVRKLTIQRIPTTADGKPMNYPWTIEIENGTGSKEEKEDGRVICKAGSYICLKKGKKFLNDSEMFECFDLINTTLNMFELTYGRQAYIDGIKHHINNTTDSDDKEEVVNE